MPLAVKDFTWEETESMVFITVPLKGVKANKADVFSSDEYLKVSYPPYFFECLLFAPVKDKESSAAVGNGAVVFKLKKEEPKIWSQLQSDDATNKEVMRAKREEALAKAHERAQEEAKAKSEFKDKQKRFGVSEMMKLDEQNRKYVDDRKEAETKKAMEELEEWKEQQRREAEQEKQRLLREKQEEEAARKAEEERQREASGQKRRGRRKKQDIFEVDSGGNPTRQTGKIEVSFTPRVFPTPVRESQTPAEEEWLKKQTEARRAIELEDKDLTEEEKNPLWLRDKGNSFFQAGNYQAAINAYSHGIRLNHRMPALYSNRAACYLKMRNFFKCIEDCSKALDCLTPPVPQNAASRAKAHVRRGTAYCQLELYLEGLQDYEAALKIAPDEKLQADADKLRQIVQGSIEPDNVSIATDKQNGDHAVEAK